MRSFRMAFGATAFACALAAQSATAQIPPPPDGAESLVQQYTGRTYSPYAERDFPDNVYWGDTHLHTSLSMDAGAFGNR